MPKKGSKKKKDRPVSEFLVDAEVRVVFAYDGMVVTGTDIGDALQNFIGSLYSEHSESVRIELEKAKIAHYRPTEDEVGDD